LLSLPTILRFAHRADRFLSGALIDMATAKTLVPVPDQFIERIVEAAAGVTHHASLSLAHYISADLFCARLLLSGSTLTKNPNI
jgi:hypothetical protein